MQFTPGKFAVVIVGGAAGAEQKGEPTGHLVAHDLSKFAARAVADGINSRTDLRHGVKAFVGLVLCPLPRIGGKSRRVRPLFIIDDGPCISNVQQPDSLSQT